MAYFLHINTCVKLIFQHLFEDISFDLAALRFLWLKLGARCQNEWGAMRGKCALPAAFPVGPCGCEAQHYSTFSDNTNTNNTNNNNNNDNNNKNINNENNNSEKNKQKINQ